MAREISVTVTCGIGSERHNHDLDYREALEHVHGRENGVIEVIPYRSYEEQINELMKPFIDQYNEHQRVRYQAAWDRYNAGEIKTKPRRANYKPMSYDYYKEHKDDTYFNRQTGKNEPLPIFRSLILGLGDKADRHNGVISEQEAVSTLKGVISRWNELYPDFRLLGASVHLDEEGFYHGHIDYKPLFATQCDQSLQCSISQEAALKHMGFNPEQSIINGRDKVPIRFNAFRNALYRATESELSRHNIRLQYGISKTKAPGKDSSKNQRLEVWREIQDSTRELQHTKNNALDILAKDEVSPDELNKAITSAGHILETLNQIQESPRARLTKDKSYAVPFRLFDQLGSFVKDMLTGIGHVFKQVEQLTKRLADVGKTNEELTRENNTLRIENRTLANKVDELTQSPAQDFIQEALRRDLFRRYDQLLKKNPHHQQLIYDRMDKAMNETEREFDPRPPQDRYHSRDDINLDFF